LLWICILIVYLWITTLSEVFPCVFLSCKANSRAKPAKTGHGPHSSYFLCFFLYIFCVVLPILCSVSFSVLFVCICVLNSCHRVATQLQLNLSYHIISYHIISYHIISYHIISYRIIYHIISYHIISYHKSEMKAIYSTEMYKLL